MNTTRTIVFLLFCLLLPSAFADTPLPGTVVSDPSGTKPFDIFDQGLGYEYAPNAFKIYFRFWMQDRVTFSDFDEDDRANPDAIDFTVRRARVRLDGTIFDSRLMYKIQLGFSNGDLDVDSNNYPNILRDAMLGYKLTPKSTIWMGQGKLPGNRQRVVSSSELELVDRSLLSATFNIDRDLGIQYWHEFGEERPFWVKVAVSDGEGRAVPNKSLSINYTGRVEWLPLGNFKDKGDYSEGDLAYETSPKLAFGATYNYDKNTSRVGGQIGKFLKNNEVRDLKTVLVDGLLKYRGWAWSSEYAYRDANSPVIDPTQSVYKGKAFNTQLSYVFANNYSPAIRWTRQIADQEILAVENNRTQYTIGLSKYYQKHKIKLQGDLTYEEVRNPLAVREFQNWYYRFQLEVGI